MLKAIKSYSEFFLLLQPRNFLDVYSQSFETKRMRDVALSRKLNRPHSPLNKSLSLSNVYTIDLVEINEVGAREWIIHARSY